MASSSSQKNLDEFWGGSEEDKAYDEAMDSIKLNFRFKKVSAFYHSSRFQRNAPKELLDSPLEGS